MKTYINQLIKDKQYQEANRAILTLLSKKESKIYSVFCAQVVLQLFEDVYPDDDRPRLAIKAAGIYLANPNETTKEWALTAAQNSRATAREVRDSARQATERVRNSRNVLKRFCDIPFEHSFTLTDLKVNQSEAGVIFNEALNDLMTLEAARDAAYAATDAARGANHQAACEAYYAAAASNDSNLQRTMINFGLKLINSQDHVTQKKFIKIYDKIKTRFVKHNKLPDWFPDIKYFASNNALLAHVAKIQNQSYNEIVKNHIYYTSVPTYIDKSEETALDIVAMSGRPIYIVLPAFQSYSMREISFFILQLLAQTKGLEKGKNADKYANRWKQEMINILTVDKSEKGDNV